MSNRRYTSLSSLPRNRPVMLGMALFAAVLLLIFIFTSGTLTATETLLMVVVTVVFLAGMLLVLLAKAPVGRRSRTIGVGELAMLAVALVVLLVLGYLDLVPDQFSPLPQGVVTLVVVLIVILVTSALIRPTGGRRHSRH